MASDAAGDRSATARARGALRLRSAVLAALAGRETLLPGVPSEDWSLFLSSERCARPLARSLERGSLPAGAPPAAEEPLRRRIEAETRRVLAARHRLSELAEVAREGAFRPVVLKGGAALVDEEAVDVGDVDVLLPPEQAEPFARALEARGYRRGPSAGTWHLEALSGDGPVPVEVHHGLSVEAVSGETAWKGAEPLAGHDGLFRLAPADHLWHVLHHGVVEHPNRRGRLRDLVLTAEAARRCGAGALRAVIERAGEHPGARPLMDQLGMTQALVDGESPEDDFRAEAASHYLLWGLLEPRGLPRPLSVRLFDAAVERLGSREDRRRAWGKLTEFPEGVSGFGWIGSVERRVPALGRAWRLGLRAGRQVLASAIARPVAWRARRLAAEEDEEGEAVAG